MPIPWDPPLRQRRLAVRRLAGIDVFHDFEWREVFGHNQSAFPHGQSLATMVRRDTPTGKRPTLLLTTRESEAANTIETDDRFIAVVPIRDYLATSVADSATTYYARTSAQQVTRLASLRDVSYSPGELQQFLSTSLTPDALRAWAEASPERRALLAELGAHSDGGLRLPASGLLAQLTEIDEESLGTIVQMLRGQEVASYAQPLLDLLSATTSGREALAESIVSNIGQRLRDVRRQVAEYEAVIGQSGATETNVQQFLERCPWIVGLPYVRARGRVPLPRGTADFVLDRFDGFFDIVELKGPEEPIVVDRESSQDAPRPGAASALSLSPALSNALAQAHMYRSNLRGATELREQFGLADTRQPRIIILIGLARSLSTNGKEVLRELNMSLHRVEVVPYDLLGRRVSGMIGNIEELLTAPQIGLPGISGP